MLTVEETMSELCSMGEDNIKKILLKHGVKEPLFGVKVENLKKLQKKIKTDYPLAKQLYATGNADAMYLAGLVTDDDQMTLADLRQWVKQANSDNICDYTVPWVAAQGNYGYQLSLEWIDDPEIHIAAAGWSTLSCHVALTADDSLDIPLLRKILDRVVATIHTSDNRIRRKMNAFVIALGIYVAPLTEEVIAAAKKIGVVNYEAEGTACKAADAVEYIMKVKNKGAIGKKKKEVKC